MGYLQTEVTWTPDGTSTDIDISDWTRLTIRKGSDAKSNTVELILKNQINRIPTGETISYHRYVDDTGILVFRENDVITVKAKYTDQVTTLTDDDIIIVADIVEMKGQLDNRRSTITIKAVDKTFALLNNTYAAAFTKGQGFTAPEIIQRAVQTASERTSGIGGSDLTAELQTESTYEAQRTSTSGKYIQTRRIDDSVFPVTTISKVYKPVYEWIDDLSAIEKTNDFSVDDQENPTQNRKMRYYVDKDNNFHWFYPDDTVDLTITSADVSADGEVTSANLTKSTFDIVNFVIFNTGLDMYGVGTLNYYFDDTTKSKKLLTKYKAYNEEAANLIQKEINSGNLVANASGSFTFQGNRYNRNGTVTPSWTTTSYSNDDDYNNSLRSELFDRGKSRAQAFTSQRGSPRWKGTVGVQGQNYTAGELVDLTILPLGINSQNLRINDMTHNITPGGWSTSLSLEEDDDSIGTNTPNR